MKLFSFSAVLFSAALLSFSTYAQNVTVNGKLKNGARYKVFLLEKDGNTRVSSVRGNGRFSFPRVSKSALTGASLHLVNPAGRYSGPVVFQDKRSKVSTTFSGKLAQSQRTIELGTVSVKSGYGSLTSAAVQAAGAVFGKAVTRAVRGKPLGAGEQGLVRTTSGAAVGAVRTAAADAGADGDRDGIPSVFDVDDDGDLTLDGSDRDSSGGDIPYSSLFLDFRNSINANIRSGLSDEIIDGVISGENVFNLTIFSSLPPELASNITGGHVICADALSYCRRNTPVGFYGGVSESNSDFRDRPWSELLTSAGYPRLERISVGGNPVMVASIQPRVGRDEVRVGDVLQAVLTNADGETVRSRTFTVAPYFVSVPALQSYDAGSGVVTVDYGAINPTSGSIPGGAPSDPIVLSPSGQLTVTFWRPQREAIRSDETGYYDWGNLNYGIQPGNAQATCAGLYSGVSSELDEDTTPFGVGDSILYNQGANGTPYRDTVGDRLASSANTLTMTVDLKQCLTRAGVTAVGTHEVGVKVAGEDVTGGQSAAMQRFYVQVQ